MLAAATKALHDTEGVNGLVPTLLVFGALPHVILEVKQAFASFPTQLDRMHMMSIAMDAAEKHVAVSRLAEAEKHTVPSGDYILSPGDNILVFREKEGWTGPATFIDRIGGSVSVVLKWRKATFPNTSVKPAFLNVGENLDDDISENLDDNVGEKLVNDVGDKLDDGVGDEAQILEYFHTHITDVIKNPHDKRFENAIKA
jgi:hypothetical protein